MVEEALVVEDLEEEEGWETSSMTSWACSQTLDNSKLNAIAVVDHLPSLLDHLPLDLTDIHMGVSSNSSSQDNRAGSPRRAEALNKPPPRRIPSRCDWIALWKISTEERKRILR